MNPTATRTGPRPGVTLILALVILIPALLGFATKFREFLLLVNDEEGAFTVMPVLSYLLLSLGFLFFFGWALFNGMFRDMENPKRQMLDNEGRLDEAAQQEREDAEAYRWMHE